MYNIHIFPKEEESLMNIEFVKDEEDGKTVIDMYCDEILVSANITPFNEEVVSLQIAAWNALRSRLAIVGVDITETYIDGTSFTVKFEVGPAKYTRTARFANTENMTVMGAFDGAGINFGYGMASLALALLSQVKRLTEYAGRKSDTFIAAWCKNATVRIKSLFDELMTGKLRLGPEDVGWAEYQGVLLRSVIEENDIKKLIDWIDYVTARLDERMHRTLRDNKGNIIH